MTAIETGPRDPEAAPVEVAPRGSVLEVLGVRHVERSQNQRIQYAEHDCIGPNGECKYKRPLAPVEATA